MTLVWASYRAVNLEEAFTFFLCTNWVFFYLSFLKAVLIKIVLELILQVNICLSYSSHPSPPPSNTQIFYIIGYQKRLNVCLMSGHVQIFPVSFSSVS